MAADDGVTDVDSREFEVATNCNEEVTCEYCQKLKDHLEATSEELKSAHLIIKLLQEEIKTQHGEYNDPSNHVTSSKSDFSTCGTVMGKWIPVIHSSHTKTSKVRTSSTKTNLQIVPISNRFAPLADLKSEVSQNRRNVTTKKKTIGRKHKVLIISDSHMRGCADKIADLLGNTYSVTSIIKPNARLSAITSSLKREIESLTQKDFVIICGGTNDVARNETTLGLRNLAKFVESINNTNIIVLGVPHRYDLLSTSCVNTEVNSFNRKLKKILKRYKNVRIVNMGQNRDYFTLQGFHLNALGKRWISNELADSIGQLCATFKKTPSIQLPWKNEDSWVKPKENEDTRINELQDGKMKMLGFQCESGIDCDKGHGINRQSDNTAMVNMVLEQERTDTENCGKVPHMEGIEVNRQVEDEQGRDSIKLDNQIKLQQKRLRKVPIKRSSDFLWTDLCKA